MSTKDTCHDTRLVVSDCFAKPVGCQNFRKEVETEIWRIIGDEVIGDADVQEIVEASEERCEILVDHI